MKTDFCIVACAAFLILCSGRNVQAQIPVGVAIEHDSTSRINAVAGDTIHFRLRACDDRGGTVTNWDTAGKTARLSVQNSHAETDSSTRSWSSDPESYTWLSVFLNGSILQRDSIGFPQGRSVYYYTIPQTAFTLGHAALDFIQTSVDTGIVLSLIPWWPSLQQESPPIDIEPTEHADYQIELTRPLPDSNAVYLLRRYEIVVTPRDRYMNPITGRITPTRFTARFPNEFDQNQPGLSDIFNQSVPLNGQTAILLSSRIRRILVQNEESQWIEARAENDSLVRSRLESYQILDHAPYTSTLLTPVDQTEIRLWFSSYTEKFSWRDTIPHDPYDNILVSRFDSTDRYSDDVRFSVTFADAASLTRAETFMSDAEGSDTVLTITHGRLDTLISITSGLPSAMSTDLVWWVEATDGLYETQSRSVSLSGRPGFMVRLQRVGDLVAELPSAGHFSLGPNFPNPFPARTTITCGIPCAGHASLRVFNFLGEQVAVLHDGPLPAGDHKFLFDAAVLPSGIYSCRLETAGLHRTRQMLLLR